MNIFVLIKKVPDPNLPEQFVSVAPDGSEIVLHPSAQASINLYDLNAIELAVVLKEAQGGTVTVITAGDASCDQYLRRAVSVGADKAVRVDLPAAQGSDGLATAAALAEGIRAAGTYDLIIAGRQASDTDAGFVPHALAAMLDIGSLSPIVSVGDRSDAGLIVGKLSDETIDQYELALPALICVSNEINKPRTPTIKGVMAGKKVQIETVAAATDGQPQAASYRKLGGMRETAAKILREESADEKAAVLLAEMGI